MGRVGALDNQIAVVFITEPDHIFLYISVFHIEARRIVAKFIFR